MILQLSRSEYYRDQLRVLSEGGSHGAIKDRALRSLRVLDNTPRAYRNKHRDSDGDTEGENPTGLSFDASCRVSSSCQSRPASPSPTRNRKIFRGPIIYRARHTPRMKRLLQVLQCPMSGCERQPGAKSPQPARERARIIDCAVKQPSNQAIFY